MDWVIVSALLYIFKWAAIKNCMFVIGSNVIYTDGFKLKKLLEIDWLNEEIGETVKSSLWSVEELLWDKQPKGREAGDRWAEKKG